MSRKNRESFDLYRIEVSLEAVKKMPTKARRIYHLAGNIANEINELHRLTILSLEQQNLPKPLDRLAIDRAWVMLRVLIGKTYEAARFVEEHLAKGGEFYKDYLDGPLHDAIKYPYLDDYQRNAYQRVWDRIEKRKGILFVIRNKIAFHYKLLPHLDDALEALDESWDQSWYSAGSMRHMSRHASLNAGAEAVTVMAMLQKVIETGAITGLSADKPEELQKAMETLADEVTDSAGEVADLMETLIVCILEHEKVADTVKHEKVMDLNNAPSIFKFRIPPFLKSNR